MTYGDVIVALADPTRRRIFESLRHGARSVTKIAADVPVSRPAVSQHLRILQDAKLVVGTPVGNTRQYRIDPEGISQLQTYLNSFWDDVLISYGAEVTRRTLGIEDTDDA